MNREWCDKNVRVVSYGAEQRGIVTLAEIPRALKDEPLDLTPEQDQLLSEFGKSAKYVPGMHVDWNWYMIEPGWELVPLHTAGLYRLVKSRRPKS